MKKLLIIFMTTLVLVGCGGSNNSNQTKEKEAFVFETHGTTIKMNEEVSSILKALGKEQDYFEAKSCAFDGMDKTYTYAGFKLVTYPKDDKDYVNQVVLQDDTVSTKEGVSIGDTKAKVEETYGKDYKDKNGAYVYTQGDSTLEFIFDGDSVSSITYTAITK
jgi:uncharacterized protein YceK